MTFQQTTLPNGLTILAEVQPTALSAALGFFVRTGARDETPELAGVSHFLEHMAFKGSEKRTAEEVNRQFDDIGAKYNAYTTEEHTVYYAAVIPEYVDDTVEMLADLLRPSLRSEDFTMEQKVIIEEIGMYADSPMWTAYEKAMRLHFPKHPLGNSVLGTQASVGALTPESMRGYFARRYNPANIFVAATGNIDWPKFVAKVTEQCANWQPTAEKRNVFPAEASTLSESVVKPEFVQQCLFMTMPGPSATDPRRIPAEVLSTIIGDETASRFYWEFVEPGKVEGIEFSFHEYEGAGLFMAGATCSPDNAKENLAEMRAVLADFVATGPSEEELERAKTKLGTRVVLAGERPQNRLGSLGYNWSYRKTYRSIADDLNDISSVTVNDIRNVLRDFPLRESATVCLGPLAM